MMGKPHPPLKSDRRLRKQGLGISDGIARRSKGLDLINSSKAMGFTSLSGYVNSITPDLHPTPYTLCVRLAGETSVFAADLRFFGV